MEKIFEVLKEKKHRSIIPYAAKSSIKSEGEEKYSVITDYYSEKLPLHNNNKSMVKSIKMTLFRTLEIKQRLAKIEGPFIFINELISVITVSLCHFNLPYSHSPLLNSTVILKSIISATALSVKTSVVAVIGGGRVGFELPPKLHS